MRLQEETRFEIEDQLGIDSIHENHPVASEFKEIFGDHTFFLDERGLCIVVPVEVDGPEIGNIVKVASWSDDYSQLVIHEPEIMPVIVDLMPADARSAG